MATFRYIGCHKPNPKTGRFSVVLPTSNGRVTVAFDANSDFVIPDDEVSISSLEYHIDSWTREYDFMRVG